MPVIVTDDFERDASSPGTMASSSTAASSKDHGHAMRHQTSTPPAPHKQLHFQTTVTPARASKSDRIRHNSGDDVLSSTSSTASSSSGKSGTSFRGKDLFEILPK